MIKQVLAAGCTLTLALSGVGSGTARAEEAPGVPALRAADFVDSIGVATHLNYRDTVYNDRDLIAKRLEESGIKHIRDGWGTGSSDVSRFVRERLGPLGVKVTMVHDPRNNATALQQKEMVKRELLPVLAAAESLNEWDLKGAGWAGYAREWTRQMSQAYRSDPATAHVPLIGPSLAYTMDRPAHAALGDLSDVVDYGNTHDYPGDAFQMTDSIMRTVHAHQGLAVPGKGVVATETGFSNGNLHAPYPAMPEEQAGALLPRLFLDHYRGGIARTFSYELIDEGTTGSFEHGFGLLRNDGSPKPAFRTVSALTRLLADPGPSFTPGVLGAKLSGGDVATRSMLLQKRDGSFWLALWQQDKLWDGRKVLHPAPRPVTLTLDRPASSVRVHTLTGEAGPSWSGTSSVRLESSAEAVLVEVRGAGAAPRSDAAPAAEVPAAATPAGTVPLDRGARYVSDLPWITDGNGWGPAERDRSNGEAERGDGAPLTVAGSTFRKGIGVNGRSDISVALDGAKTFTAQVGIDDETDGRGSVAFQVWADGRKLADSGLVRAGAPARAMTVDVSGHDTLRLVVTDGGDGTAFDHADWGDARLLDVGSAAAASTTAPVTRPVPLAPVAVAPPVAPAPAAPAPPGKPGKPGTRHLSAMDWVSSSNGTGPVERDRANGSKRAGDGGRLRIAGRTYARGLGMTSPAEVRVAVGGATTFTAKVGLDAEARGRGSVVFQVWADGVKLLDTGVVRGKQAARSVRVDVRGRQQLRLVVTDGRDGRAYDRADWADAVLS